MIDTVNNAESATAEQHDPDRELKQRLAAAKLERARLAEEREGRERKQALADELEREELALRNDQAIAEAEAAHGPLGKKIAAVYSELGVVIVKRPHHVNFRKFQDAGKVTSVECEKLVRPCLVHPVATTFDVWIENEPALLLRVANQVAALAGVRGEEIAGK